MDDYEYPDVDSDLVEYMNKETGVFHHQPKEMTKDEKYGDTMLYLEQVSWKGSVRYICRLHSLKTDKWFIEEMDYLQFQATMARMIQTTLLDALATGNDLKSGDDLLSIMKHRKPVDKDQGFGINIGDQISKMNEISKRLREEKREEMDGVSKKKLSDKDANYRPDELISEDEFKRMWGGE